MAAPPPPPPPHPNPNPNPRSFSEEDGAMQALRAICHTLVPPLVSPSPKLITSTTTTTMTIHNDKSEAHPHHQLVIEEEEEEMVSSFFALSATSDGFPEEVASKMSTYLRQSELMNVRRLLWLLSTRLGTLLLCGRHALVHDKKSQSSSSSTKKKDSSRDDSSSSSSSSSSAAASSAHHRHRHRLLEWVGGGMTINSFSSLPLASREKILISWASGAAPIPSMRLVFQLFKLFVLREFYSKVGVDGTNPIVWKAMKYPGPDPATMPHGPDECDIVLESRIVDCCNHNPGQITAQLQKLGVKTTVAKNSRKIQIDADAVIVGSGAGGSVVAARIAEAGYRVVVVEKGRYFPRSELHLLEGRSTDMYEHGSYLTTNGGTAMLFAGSNLGGGTTINWSASFKTPRHVRKEWATQFGLQMFEDGSEYEEVMEKICARMGVQQDAAKPQESLGNAMLRKGCEALGMHVANVPRNSAAEHYCGWCGMGCKSGNKKAAGRIWLPDAVKAGAVILTSCEARQVTLWEEEEEEEEGTLRTHGGRRRGAGGVIARSTWGGSSSSSSRCWDGQIELEIRAQVVVMAAGALWTPVLLRRSGLRNKHIGKNLHIHPVLSSWGYFPDAPSHVKPYEGGIMTSFSAHAANWATSGYGALLMVPSLHPGGFAAFMPWRGAMDSKQTMLRFSKTAHIIALTRDTTSGAVTEDREGRLSIDYNMSDVDRLHCLGAACNALRVLAASGASLIGTPNVDGAAQLDISGPSANPPTQLEDFLVYVRSSSLRNSNSPLGSAHQMGTCRMGVSPSTSVVDPTGETWEVKGLFIADTSVFPSATGVNPMVTAQSIAYCTSKSILRFLVNKTHDRPRQSSRL